MPLEIVGDIEKVEIIASAVGFASSEDDRNSMAKVAGGSSKASPRFVVCVDPAGNDDLQLRRIYQVLPDDSAARSDFVRVIDD